MAPLPRGLLFFTYKFFNNARNATFAKLIFDL